MIPLKAAKRVVIKLGTGVLTKGIGQLDTDRISEHCQQVQSLRQRGIEVVVVSSGAIGLGMGKLGIERRPKDLASLQACAAVGQTILMNTWQKCFDAHSLTVAQILLTREDLRARHRHNAVFNTLERLLSQGTVPIVNENDTVSASEIKFGDNDTLSALVASVINADLLFILSNIEGLIDMQGTGKVIPYVPKITQEIEAMAQGTKQTTSVGGMISKLSAAKIAQRAGCGVVIGSGQDTELFDKILEGKEIATYFAPSDLPVKSHKRWIAIQDDTQGALEVDEGAAKAIIESGKSLLLAGITKSEGNFEPGDVLLIRSATGSVFAHGTAEIDSDQLSQCIGLNNAEAAKILPSPFSAVIVHRDNLVLL